MSDIHKHKDGQKAFAAHIRDPHRYPRPVGVDELRMQVYRDLFFNNISNLIKQTFPVLATLYNPEEWQQLIRSFYQPHYNKTPYFTDIADEFVRFIKKQPMNNQRPFVAELADYEWLELALEKKPIQPDYAIIKPPQLLSKSPILSPLLYARSYHFPVHQINTQFQPTDAARPTQLLIWRDRHFNVHFAILNPLTMQLLQLLQTTDLTGREALLTIFSKQTTHTEDKIIEFGHQQLLKWVNQDIIIQTQ